MSWTKITPYKEWGKLGDWGKVPGPPELPAIALPVHHSDTRTVGKTSVEQVQWVEQITFDRRDRFGHHLFLADPYGFHIPTTGDAIYEGRGLRVKNAANLYKHDTPGLGHLDNSNTISVCVAGDYQAPPHDPREDLDAICDRILDLAKHLCANQPQAILPNIIGHRDIGYTDCPGQRLYARLPELDKELKAWFPEWAARHNRKDIRV